MRILALGLVCLLLPTLTACGGSQRRLDQRTWTNAFEFVPEDASWGLAGDLQESDRALMMQSFGSMLTNLAVTPGGSEMLSVLNIDPADPESLSGLGIDLTGDYAVFSTSLAPVGVVRLSDEDAFLDLLDRAQDANPDIEIEPYELGTLTLRRAAWGSVSLDYGVFRGYGIFRFNSPDPAANMTDEAWIDALAGPRRTMLDGGPGAALVQSHTGDGPLNNLGFIQSQVFSDLIWSSRTWRDRTGNVSAMGIDPTLVGYANEDQRVRCQAVVERFTTSMPWLGFVSGRDADDANRFVGRYVIQFGTAAAERWRTILAPEITGIPDAEIESFAFWLSGRADLDAFFGLITTDPSLSTCPDLAGPLGMLSGLVSSQSRAISGFTRLYEGSVLFGLQSLTPSLFSFELSALAMVTSPDAARLADRAQDLARDNGSSTSVVNESAITRIDIATPFVDIAMLMPGDRVVFHAGTIAPALVNQVSTNPIPQGDGDFMTMFMNGTRLADIFESLVDLGEGTGMLPADVVTPVRGQIVMFRSMPWARLDGRFEGTQAVFDVNVLTTPAPAAAP